MNNTECSLKTPSLAGFRDKIKTKLDAVPSEFIQPKHLYEFGLFGSLSAATHFVQRGGIPHLKISPYRVLIMKEDVLAFLEANYKTAAVA